MDCKQKKNIKTGVESLAIATALLSLVLCSSAFIVISKPDPDKSIELQAFSGLIIFDKAGSMETNEPFNSTKSLFLTIPAVINGQNFDNTRPESKIVKYKALHNVDSSRFGNLTTTALISPKKASASTLVGAKPSGTS